MAHDVAESDKIQKWQPGNQGIHVTRATKGANATLGTYATRATKATRAKWLKSRKDRVVGVDDRRLQDNAFSHRDVS